MTNEEQIKYMVQRFLGWKLPTDFNPDNGISFERTVPHPACPPVGTNLFSADQADAMVRYMVEGMPLVKAEAEAPNPAKRFFDDAVWRSAFDLYVNDCSGLLWQAPQYVQEEYKQRARTHLGEYLAKCGIV